MSTIRIPTDIHPSFTRRMHTILRYPWLTIQTYCFTLHSEIESIINLHFNSKELLISVHLKHKLLYYIGNSKTLKTGSLCCAPHNFNSIAI
jgi:hypothetical protein